MDGGPLPSLGSYRKHFAHCEAEKYAMEATPSYCYGAKRMIEAISRPSAVLV